MTSPAPSELAPSPSEAPAGPAGRPRWRSPVVGVGGPLLLGLLHVALVAPLYHVGSFDDDASYILAAKALLAGQGLSGHLPSGEIVVGLYPPGYSALLAPLLWLWPHTFAPLRLLSVLAYSGIFPLTWLLLGRRRWGFAPRVAVLVLLALGPALATYGSMVMAEALFVDALLLLLLALDRWTDDPRVLSPWAAAVVALAASVVWLKEAGLGLIVGVFLWLLVGRHPRRLARAAVLAVGVGLTLVPVVVGRLAAGIPLAGSRYSLELGAYYQGGVVGRLHQVLPSSVAHLFSTAIPATLVPYLTPLPIGGHWPDLWKALSWHVTVLAAVGAVVWARRHRDAAVPMVAVYLVESSLWPFVNERRAILVVPLLTAWYVAGALEVGRAARRLWPAAVRRGRVAAAALAAVVVAGPLVAQMPRDYLYAWGQGSSRFGGSRYTALLRQVQPPGAVVETDYRSSAALFTGHDTNWTAFTETQGVCWLPGVLQALSQDRASYLLVGDFNKPGFLDSPCLAGLAQDAPWAVPLLHTARDDATVYELIGPGTGHPGLSDPSAGQVATVVTSPSEAAAVVTFARPALVSQVSVGAAYLGTSPAPATVSAVSLQLERPDGSWQPVAGTGSAVGGPAVPYLMARLAHPEVALAARVVIRPGPEAPVGALAVVQDLAALGPAPVSSGA